MIQDEIPGWLRIWMQGVLLRNVYPALRAVAVGYYDDRTVTLRFYVDRSPVEFDHWVMEVICGELLSNTSTNAEMPALRDEIVFSTRDQNELEALSGFVFMRMEDFDTFDHEAS
ncbi:hypothetical protein [Arvimicrobium flavum]|uniref:hypothetical protein n=1 Tax=Arvimicrobium flavum TaxID=3393320 RepID=UPI00237AA10B|nr:hypothetical protein [Mesorhizobium shangrilense]